MLAAPNDQLVSLVRDPLHARNWIRYNVTVGVDVRYHYHRLHCPPPLRPSTNLSETRRRERRALRSTG
jgi:hypothetical protein